MEKLHAIIAANKNELPSYKVKSKKIRVGILIIKWALNIPGQIRNRHISFRNRFD